MAEWKNIKKLGLGIVAFEGTEHLASIITELKDCVDYVVIGLLKVSYHGDPIAKVDLDECYRLRDEDHLVDKILDVNLDPKKEPRVQEADKRNLLMEDCEKAGCSHVIIIDSDEFYTKKSFLNALKEIDDNDYEQTYCQYINYYTLKSYLVYPFEGGMYVPFVVKSKYRVSFQSTDFPLPSDPTRRYLIPYKTEKVIINGRPTDKKIFEFTYHVFPWNVVKMHHLSWCRADIRKKLNMWSSKRCFENYNDLIDKAVDTCLHYDDSTKEDKRVSLLFNTPNHEVIVRPLAKQFIFPAFDYKTRLRKTREEKKILVINMSSSMSDCNLFNELDAVGRQTWAKGCFDGTFKNIDFYTVCDAKTTYMDSKNHRIFIKTDYNKDNINQMLRRFTDACSMIKNLSQYNYIIRANTSTWCNLALLNEFLAYQTDDSLVYGFGLSAVFWSTFNIYVHGAAMIMTPRTVEILVKEIAKTPENVLAIANDDVMIAGLLRRRAEELRLTDPNDQFIGMGGVYLGKEAADTKYDLLDWSVPFYQIKTFSDSNWPEHKFRLKNDIEKMKMLDAAWEANKPSNLTELLERMQFNFNKTINVIPYLKKQWLSGELSDEQKMKARFLEMPYNQETLNFLHQKAIEGGYRQA